MHVSQQKSTTLASSQTTSACDHELRVDVLIEDGQMRRVRYCARKRCGYRETVEGDPRRRADHLRTRLPMTRLAGFALALVTGCASLAPTVTDPRATGPGHQEWAATVPATRRAAFDAAVRVLTDSAYRIAGYDTVTGQLVTQPRKESEVLRGSAQARAMTIGADNPITLHLFLSPERGDSTRIAIRGETWPARDPIPIAAHQGEWRFVRGIGEAMLARLQR